MVTAPDIVIVDPEQNRLLVAVEVKRHLAKTENAERQLKEYMFNARCPMGLIITPDSVQFFEDQHSTYSPESIIKVSEIHISDYLSKYYSPSARTPGGGKLPLELELESAAYKWLEGLPMDASRLPTELRNAVEKYLLPILNHAEVRSTGPRYHLYSNRV